MLIWRIAVAALCVAAAGCDRGTVPEVALGTLERDRVELTTEVNEPITAVSVREGDHVAIGQPLLSQARGAVSQAKNRLAELVKGPRAEDIQAARASLAGAESQANSAGREFERVRALVEQKLLSASALDQQRAARDVANAARLEAREQLRQLLKGTRIEQLDQARDAVTQAESRLAELDVAAGRLTTVAPIDGSVEALPYKPGERPPAGNPVVVLLRDGAPYARVYVPEPLRTRVRPGTAASIHADGLAAPLAGTVRYIAAEAAFTPYYALTQRDRSRLSFLAEVTVTDPAGAALPAGLPVEVRFPAVP
ncbi:MAG: HlyD family efflux transporter periplasmic adaptor subunit [Gammaproteobacteria bacterium]